MKPSAAADAEGGLWLAWVRRSVSGDHSLMTKYIAGGGVKTIRIHDATSGKGSVPWSGRDEGGRKVQSGVYFYRLTVGDETVTRKMLLVE